MTNVLGIIQCRMNSKRLPQKISLDIYGKPLLQRVVERVKIAKTLNKVVVATSLYPLDDWVEDICSENKWDYFRGNEDDVLDRFYQCAKQYKADVIVRITADCPLIDYGIIDNVVNMFLRIYPNIEYGSNLLPRTFPRGLDVEVISYGTLENEWANIDKWREHVTLNIRKNIERYERCNYESVIGNCSHMRWVVDNTDDLEFIRKVYSKLKDDDFSWVDILNILRSYPDWVIKDTQIDPQ